MDTREGNRMSDLDNHEYVSRYDDSVVYLARFLPSSDEYEIMRTGDEVILGRVPKEQFENIYLLLEEG